MGLRIAEAPLRRTESAPRPKLQDDAILAKFRDGEALSGVELDRYMVIQSRGEIAARGMERKRAAAQRLDVIAIKALASKIADGDDPRSFCVPFRDILPTECMGKSYTGQHLLLFTVDGSNCGTFAAQWKA